MGVRNGDKRKEQNEIRWDGRGTQVGVHLQEALVLGQVAFLF